ncbi:hypothetical protein BSIN_1963 [Burkholderia singularis]|uniref:Uncharacterized protein n=1 Tax=Burkholderia singularis TaxID=1503053 RepID=A0A238H0H0_9BURK|nr:hypothetical protein BSIN_1963 [Burkholderia singularis]
MRARRAPGVAIAAMSCRAAQAWLMLRPLQVRAFVARSMVSRI